MITGQLAPCREAACPSRQFAAASSSTYRAGVEPLSPAQEQGQSPGRGAPRPVTKATLQGSRFQRFSTSLATSLDDTTPDISRGISEKIKSQITQQEVGRLFAVVYIAGKQRKITSEDIIILDKHIEANIGERIIINKVLLVGSKDFSLVGTPVLSPDLVRVEATVTEKTLSYTKVLFRYLRRENNRKMRLRKERLTHLRINSIEVLTLNEDTR